MARDLERYFDELERRVTCVEGDSNHLDSKVRWVEKEHLHEWQENKKVTSEIRDVLAELRGRLEKLEAYKAPSPRQDRIWHIFSGKDWEQPRLDAEGGFYYGLPIKDMGRDELLFIIGKQMEAMKRSGILLW